MKVIVKGTTGAVLTLNLCGVFIHGPVKAIIDIDNEAKKKEIQGLIRHGLIQVLEVEKKKGEAELSSGLMPPKPKNVPKKKRESKNKDDEIDEIIPEAKTEQERAFQAEAKTDKMGSRVVVATPSGIAEGKMKQTFVPDMPEPKRAEASIRAMEKLEEEEAEEALAFTNSEDVIKEGGLDPSEQMGRTAVVSGQKGEQRVQLQNSIISGDKKNKKHDPFLDREENAEREDKLANAAEPILPPVVDDIDDDLKIDDDNHDDEYSDAFIET